MNKKYKPLLYILTFMTAFLADRITKLWVLKILVLRKTYLGTFLNFRLVWNKGITWGLLSSESNFGLISLALLISIVIIIFFIHTIYEYKKNENILFNVLILSGATSNLLDRVLYRGVIDFIDLHINSWHWPAFNLADIFIVVGVFGIIGRYLYYEISRKH